jgi:RimJ/RimL family protein N-acetyltransferase
VDVQLRAVSPDDLPIFFEQQRDPVAIRMAAFLPRDREAFDAHWAKILVDPTTRVRTILFRGQVAGNVGSFELQGSRHVGYWLGQEFWGQGIASRALAEFLEEEGVRPLYARAAKHNLASIRVLEKCGFLRAGEDSTPLQPGGEAIEDWIMKLGGNA